MQFSVKREAGRSEVTLSGRMTFADAGQFSPFLDQAVKGAQSCLIDLSQVSFIDSTGLSLFIHVYDLMRSEGIQVTLKGATGPAADALHRASFDTLFKMA
jgi:anti-anti-sigma factor